MGDLSEIPLGRLKNLTSLTLKNANLSISSSRPINELDNLYSFDISHNNLNNADFSALSTLTHLEFFSAVNCEIENISKVIKYSSLSVEELDLSRKTAGDLNIGIFDGLINLKSLK